MSKKSKKSSSTPELDLHGVKHADAEILIEEFVLLNEPPVILITGHSSAMKNIAIRILKKHNYKYQDGDFFSSGCITVLS